MFETGSWQHFDDIERLVPMSRIFTHSIEVVEWPIAGLIDRLVLTNGEALATMARLRDQGKEYLFFGCFVGQPNDGLKAAGDKALSSF